MIKVTDLVKDYKQKRAVDHLDLTIKKGEVFGLLGPNGAGKTTIILSLLGLTEPTSGSVYVNDWNATSEPLKVKRIIGYLPDNVGFPENSSGFESLIYTGMLNGIPEKKAAEKAAGLLKVIGLEDAGYRKTKTYSKGMKQRLGLADVLMKDPEIMILDEPTTGIDPKGIQEFLRLIRNLSKQKGITVLLSSHLLHQVQRISDRVGILVDGKLLAEGNVQELAEKLSPGQKGRIIVKSEPITDDVIRELMNLPDIGTIKKENGHLIIEGSSGLLPYISKTLVYRGADLYQISSKEYSLDDIYQHYFEGGAEHV